MPYGITVNDERCEASKPFSVVKEDDNALMGCHETRQDAVAQIAALEAAEASKAKEDAPNYRPVADDAAQKCTNCRFNTRPQFCERFDFIFDPNHVCDAWESRRRQARGNEIVKEHKNFTSLGTKVVDLDQGIVEHIVTVFGVLDYVKDISHPGSFTKTLAERGHKALVLDMHNSSSVMNVLGKPLQIAEIPREQLPPAILNEFPEATGGVKATTQFFLDTPEGKGAFIRLKRDGIREWSYGYDALDVDFETVRDKQGNEVNARNLRTIKLYEYGPVLWGAVPGTSTLSAKGQGKDSGEREVKEELVIVPSVQETAVSDVTTIYGEFINEQVAMDAETESKRVIGAANLPLAPRARAWDSSAAESRVRSWADAQDGPNAQYRRAFFWVDSDASENFTSYKLQFADIVGGEFQAIPRGLFAVAGVLEGARGGVDIPDSDKATIRRKVSAYYSKMRREFDDDSIVPPWDKAQVEAVENKAINLTEIVGTVVTAFYTQYPDTFEPSDRRNVYWVEQVWDEFIITKQEGVIANTLWKVSYTVSEKQVIFEQPSAWQEMQSIIVPMELTSGIMGADVPEEGKIGRAISAANGRRIAAAIVALAELLEATGIDIPGFGRAEAAQHEDEEEEKVAVVKIDDGSRYIISFPQKLPMAAIHRLSIQLNEWIDGDLPFAVMDGGAKLMRIDSTSIEGKKVIVDNAPTPDEQAAIENQPDGQPTEAGPAEVPPTPKDKDLTDWIALEREALDLLKLGGE